MYRYWHHSHAPRRPWQRASGWNRTHTRFAASYDSTRLRSLGWRMAELFDPLQWELWKLARLLASLLNPLRNPSAVVAVVMTFLEEIGAPVTWTQVLFTFLANLAGLQLVTWLIGEVAISAIVTFEQWRLRLARRAPIGARSRRVRSLPARRRRL